MSPEQYWDGDCTLTEAYREAYKLKLKAENRSLWLQGLYIYEALCDVSPVLHAFAKRGTRPAEYLKEPIAITAEEVRERQERDERIRYENIKMRVCAYATGKNIQFAKQAAEKVRTDG